ncbi:SH3 domain-containing protein [Thermodesulfobacteriota bacterium]
MAERMAVKSPLANIRSGPGTTHEVLWKVEKYHPLVIFQKSGNWYRFRDFEGDQGWIHRSLLGKINTVITTKDICNIRSGPGTSNKILFSVGKGIPFKIIRPKGTWLHIEHADGDSGWIHKSLVW